MSRVPDEEAMLLLALQDTALEISTFQVKLDDSEFRYAMIIKK